MNVCNDGRNTELQALASTHGCKVILFFFLLVELHKYIDIHGLVHRLISKIQKRELGDYRVEARCLGPVRAEPVLVLLPWLVFPDFRPISMLHEFRVRILSHSP